MQEEGVIRFSVLVVSPREDDPRKFFTLNETDLDDGGDLQISPSDAYFPENGQLSFNLPTGAGYCSIGHTLFLVGGVQCYNDSPICSNRLWSFNSASPPPTADGITWSICTEMHHEREYAVAVPYDGKIFIFGGFGVILRHSWVEIYDPHSGLLMSKDLPRGLDLDSPTSYFLLKDRADRHKKPLIVLHCDSGGHCRLYSYDVERNHWKLFDPCFPAPPPRTSVNVGRNLIPLGSSDALLIIDRSALWSIYNLSSKQVTGEVMVQGLKKDREVIYAFSRHCSDERCQIFYLFMEGDTEEFQIYCSDVPFAKVRLQTEGEKLFAFVELEGALSVGAYFDLYMLTEQSSKRTLKEAPLGVSEDKKRMKL